MITYDDLSLRDVHSYWGSGSVLLFERKGKYIACEASVNTDSNYPITLTEYATGERIISLRLKTFIRRVLCHHPVLGYADYKGIPLYISSAASRGMRKAVDSGNLNMYCPLNFQQAIKNHVLSIKRKVSKQIDSQGFIDPKLEKEYNEVLTINGYISRLRNANSLSRVGLAAMIEQCVNNNYAPVDTAINNLLEKDSMYGAILSKDFAVVRLDDGLKLFHRSSFVGDMDKEGNVQWNKELSKPARNIIDTLFNKVKGS